LKLAAYPVRDKRKVSPDQVILDALPVYPSSARWKPIGMIYSLSKSK